MDKRYRWNERYAKKDLMWSAGPNVLLESLVTDLPPGRAIDVATGEGRNAIWLAEQGWQVDAIDFSDVGVSKARTIAESKQLDVNWIVADVCEHQFPSLFYDLAAVAFLHTAPTERAKWLGAVINSIAPGGYFLYIAHDPSNVAEGVGGPQDISLLPTVDSVSALLAGFEILRSEVVRRSVATDPGHGGGSGTALDSLVWARREF